MKTIRNKDAGNLEGRIMRKSDKEAQTMVSTGKWEFIPKKLWKDAEFIEEQSRAQEYIDDAVGIFHPNYEKDGLRQSERALKGKL